ncbi:MAG: methyltransferase [Desulfovibrionaceae bacterium]|nr:methyltransferase [Desulfovibrionaceae bacterium]
MRTWTTQSLLAFSSAYWEVCALHAAVAADVFTALADGPLNDAELAAKAGLSPRGAKGLAAAACALGFATRRDGRTALTDFAAQHLVRGREGYLGDIVLHHHHLMDGWAQLDTAAKEGRRVRAKNEDSPETLAAFLRGMANMASSRALEVAEQLDLSGRARLMDLGGGPGSYAAAFCERNPQLSAVIFDRPTTEPFAMETVRARHLEGRITFAAGDILTSPLPQGFDAVWISHVLHGSSPEECALMCRKARAALNPGGLVCVQEFFLDDSMDGPLFPALFNLNMLQASDGGQSYTWAEVEAMLRAAGCADIRRIPGDPAFGTGIVCGTAAD